MKKFPVFIFIIIYCIYPFHLSQAQQIVKTSGEAQVEWPDTKSRNQVQQEAKDLATIDALERAFGRVIVQGNSTYLTNLNTGEQTETRSVFNMIANTSVKGEVLDVLNENYKEVDDLLGALGLDIVAKCYFAKEADAIDYGRYLESRKK